jgi:hypothetical protein
LKLVLQIAGGVVLGWIAVTLIKALLAISALSAVSQALHLNDERAQLPRLQHIAPAPPAATQTAPYVAPPITGSQTSDRPYEQTQADLQKARNERDTTSAQSAASPGYTVRKATPEDAAAKPAR